MFAVESVWEDEGAGDVLHAGLFQAKADCVSSHRTKRKRKSQPDSSLSIDNGDKLQVQSKKRKSEQSASNGSTVSSKLQKKIAGKLSGAQFRWINEQLYTTTSEKALSIFQDDPSLFSVYHRGFSEQASKWPTSPLEKIITYVKQLPQDSVIADFGCGEAKLANDVPHTVHSFDLVAVNDRVTPCDMADVPLSSSSVDVVIFCLSLMGTNVADFIREGVRVLRKGGKMKICEISSRFVSIDDFVASLKLFGLKLTSKQTIGKMFIEFEFLLFAKRERHSKSIDIHLKPCLYKRR